MKIINGGITTPKGFKASGIYCGIKKSGKPDLSLIVSDIPCPAAAVFTKNSVKAAPLIVSQENLKNSTAQAVITNSGNANCFTGEMGLRYAKQTTLALANALGIKKDDIIVSSTGIIGKILPIKKVTEGIPALISKLSSSKASGRLAAEAIMTTDTFVKEIAVTVEITGKIITIGGCAKGSGMIEPNMATMLGFLTTDAAIDKKLLKEALKQAVDHSFNSITVDGCMSTNDMTAIMANGMAGNTLINTKDKNYDLFCQALTLCCMDLAKKIVKDGEGAKKLIEVYVDGAPSEKTARQAAKAIANSNLVKTAAYGKNANWGRIAAAVGSLGLNITEKNLNIKTKTPSPKNVIIQVDLGLGKSSAFVLTCDLTEDYIKINGAYN